MVFRAARNVFDRFDDVQSTLLVSEPSAFQHSQQPPLSLGRLKTALFSPEGVSKTADPALLASAAVYST